MNLVTMVNCLLSEAKSLFRVDILLSYWTFLFFSYLLISPANNHPTLGSHQLPSSPVLELIAKGLLTNKYGGGGEVAGNSPWGITILKGQSKFYKSLRHKMSCQQVYTLTV